MSVEDMENMLPEDVLNIVKNKSRVESESYSNGVNVVCFPREDYNRR